jgi:hypothetical protein
MALRQRQLLKAPALARKATQAMEAVKLAVKAMLDAEML